MKKVLKKAFIEIISLDYNDIIITSFGYDDIIGLPGDDDSSDGDDYWN